MIRRIAKTREERLAAPRKIHDPKLGYLGTIRRLDSGFWEYKRKSGAIGLANTGREAIAKLGVCL